MNARLLAHAMVLRRLLPGALLLCATALPARAQFNNQWVEFSRCDGSLGLAPGAISNLNNEVDFAWGDLDNDGSTDLVVVRKEPFTTTGKRANLLLMNESGVLRDRTAQYAAASDVPGDAGFLTPTNDRDVVLADVDLDGWLDVVTATTLSDGDPKALGHPRIYMNLKDDAAGNWLGLKYEEARFPQLFQFNNGSPQNPSFCGVAAGDVTGDGYPDLYFADYDGGVFVGEPPGQDLDDRLLINDGNGFFNDESQQRMTSLMLQSDFGTSAEIHDINGDGVQDVVKNSALVSPYRISASYNDPANAGFFNIYDAFHVGLNSYHVDMGDLNADGRLDVLVSQDSADRYRYNLGNDPLGRVIWGPAMTFDFLAGSDDGFASNNLIADLNGDGWNDAIFCDIDVDVDGYDRRIHIYHNPGGTVGAQITLREERQSASGGWLGAVGLLQGDLEAGHDVAVFDLDNDGDNDMILGRKDGTFVWINQTVPNAPAVEAVRLGTPPNPAALMPGVTSAPIIGAVWDPVVTPFLPGAVIDFLAVANGVQMNIPTVLGTLLCNIPPPSFIFFSPPGVPFAVAIPNDCSLIGLTRCAQGGAVAPGPVIRLTNALDTVIGTF